MMDFLLTVLLKKASFIDVSFEIAGVFGKKSVTSSFTWWVSYLAAPVCERLPLLFLHIFGKKNSLRNVFWNGRFAHSVLSLIYQFLQLQRIKYAPSSIVTL